MKYEQTIPTSSLSQRLLTLAHLYEQDEASELMDRTLDKLLHDEADRCRQELNELQNDLKAFEEQYELSSEEFYQRFQAGETDDRMDFIEWASFYQMADSHCSQLTAHSSQLTAY